MIFDPPAVSFLCCFFYFISTCAFTVFSIDRCVLFLFSLSFSAIFPFPHLFHLHLVFIPLIFSYSHSFHIFVDAPFLFVLHLSHVTLAFLHIIVIIHSSTFCCFSRVLIVLHSFSFVPLLDSFLALFPSPERKPEIGPSNRTTARRQGVLEANAAGWNTLKSHNRYRCVCVPTRAVRYCIKVDCCTVTTNTPIRIQWQDQMLGLKRNHT